MLKPDELLTRALPLYAVSDGYKMRTMMDAVRDAMYQHNEGREDYRAWQCVLKSLDIASRSDGKFGGFSAWEREDGRTVAECRKVMRKAVAVATRLEHERWKRELERDCYC